MSYCTLKSPLVKFEPFPPGVQRPQLLSTGFTNALRVFKKGTLNYLMVSESYGYSLLDISNPINPIAQYYHDFRFPWRPIANGEDLGYHSVTVGGDGQSIVQTLAVSSDGHRAAFGLSGQSDPWNIVVGEQDSQGFILQGSTLTGSRPASTDILSYGNRYILHYFLGGCYFNDITSLPSNGLIAGNLPNDELSTFPNGTQTKVSGNYISYMGPTGIVVINAANPGPIGSIANNFTSTTITNSDFNGRAIQYFTTEIDPSDSSKLWVLVELKPNLGENSPSYGLLSLTSNLTKTSAGPIWRVPSLAGERWDPVGIASSLVSNNGVLYVLMWAHRWIPYSFKLYSTSTDAWSQINNSAPPNGFDIPTSLNSNGFGVGQQMFSISISGSIYSYLPTGPAAFVIPLTPVVTGGGETVPSAPTDINVSKINDTTVRLTWTPPV